MLLSYYIFALSLGNRMTAGTKTCFKKNPIMFNFLNFYYHEYQV